MSTMAEEEGQADGKAPLIRPQQIRFVQGAFKWILNDALSNDSFNAAALNLRNLIHGLAGRISEIKARRIVVVDGPPCAGITTLLNGLRSRLGYKGGSAAGSNCCVRFEDSFLVVTEPDDPEDDASLPGCNYWRDCRVVVDSDAEESFCSLRRRKNLSPAAAAILQLFGCMGRLRKCIAVLDNLKGQYQGPHVHTLYIERCIFFDLLMLPFLNEPDEEGARVIRGFLASWILDK